MKDQKSCHVTLKAKLNASNCHEGENNKLFNLYCSKKKKSENTNSLVKKTIICHGEKFEQATESKRVLVKPSDFNFKKNISEAEKSDGEIDQGCHIAERF